MELQKMKYIDFDNVIERIGKEKFEDIIQDKIVLLESEEIIKARYIEYYTIQSYSKKITRIYINLTNRCNSDCMYCFAHTQRTGIDLDYNRVISLLPSILMKCGKNISICFFGGEPTLRFDLITQIISYIESEFSDLHITYDMVTNGIELSYDKMRFIKDQFDGLTISIDGNYTYMLNNRIHDKRKLDRVYENVREACKVFDQTSIRATITEGTKDLVDSYQFFKSLGAKKIRFKPVSGFLKEEYMIKDWEYVYSQMHQLASIVEKDLALGSVRRVSPFSMYINQFKNRSTKLTGCGMNIITIGEQGDIYPCYRFVGNQDFVLNLQKKLSNEKIPLNLVDDKDKCTNCWCRYICGGGCYADSYFYMGDSKMTYNFHCGFIKEAIKLSLYMYKNIGDRI